MTNQNQTTKILKRIQAKEILGLPLCDYEKAIKTLYAEEPTKSTAATDEYDNKRNFVKDFFQPLLQALDIGIDKAEYVRNPTTREEYVVITYMNGYTRQKCVTADSLVALVGDVIHTT